MFRRLSLLLLVVAVGITFMVWRAGREAPERRAVARQATPARSSRASLEPSSAPALPPEERDVVEATPQPAPESASHDLTSRIQDWELAADGILAGRLVARRGIERWSSWRVYVTSKAPIAVGVTRGKHTDVDPVTGEFHIEGLPLGPAELTWYHPVAGMSVEKRELEIENGRNTVELVYPGPDPSAAIFVAVNCAEPVAAGEITASDGSQVFWAEELSAQYFAIADLPGGRTYTVTIDHVGLGRQEHVCEVGRRLRVDVE